MRPKAGHGWTAFHRGEKKIWLLFNCHGQMVTTGEATKWPRCARCRRPDDSLPDGRLCSTCYYYKSLPPGEFWNREKAYLFPYNIGKRITENINHFDRRPLSDPKVDWRKYLKTQTLPGAGQAT